MDVAEAARMVTVMAVIPQAGKIMPATVATGASGDELALAGKGFNSDVEAAFKAGNKEIDFTWVNRMEKMKVSPAAVEKFLRQGQVSAPGGQP